MTNAGAAWVAFGVSDRIRIVHEFRPSRTGPQSGRIESGAACVASRVLSSRSLTAVEWPSVGSPTWPRGGRIRCPPTRIISRWPDMLRVAGSLHLRTVNSYELLRMLGRDGNPTPLGAAPADYGCAPKTLHLLAMCDPDNETYLRTVHHPAHNPGITPPSRPERSSTANAANSARNTAKAKRPIRSPRPRLQRRHLEEHPLHRRGTRRVALARPRNT